RSASVAVTLRRQPVPPLFPYTTLFRSGAPEGLDALIVADRIKTQGGVVLFVARDYQRSGNFIQAFRFFAKDIEVLEYPSWDCLRSEEHTSELQSRENLVCRLLLEKKNR